MTCSVSSSAREQGHYRSLVLYVVRHLYARKQRYLGQGNYYWWTKQPVLKKGSTEDHTDCPDGSEEEKIGHQINRRASEHPEAWPAQILRTVQRDISSGVLVKLTG
ncbi:hypothetical protein TKK_0002871 [Trichogramma kaykai]